MTIVEVVKDYIDDYREPGYTSVIESKKYLKKEANTLVTDIIGVQKVNTTFIKVNLMI